MSGPLYPGFVRIQGLVEIVSATLDLHNHFLNPPTAAQAQSASTTVHSLLYLRRMALNSTTNRRVIDRRAAFAQHFFKVAIADAIPAVPAHGSYDDVALKMARFAVIHAFTSLFLT